MAKKKKQSNIRDIRESMEVPGVAINPSSATVASQMAKRKGLVLVFRIMAIGLVPIAFFLSAATFLEATSSKQAPPDLSSHTVNGAGGKAAAINQVQQWLKSEPAPLPDGQMVSWDGYTERKAPEPLKENDVRPRYVEQAHYFTLRSGDQVYDSQVLVLVDGIHGVKTVDTPTLLPRPVEATSDWAGETPWFGFRSATPSDAVITAIETWADAYVSGSPKRLKQVTGDGKEGRSYVPLSGARGVTVEVKTAGVLAPKTLAEEETWKEPNQLIARVEMAVHWEGQPEPKPGDDSSPITFDVLVTDIHSATAQVVSWGGAGSGPELTPFSIGLDGVTLKEPSENAKQSLSEDAQQPEDTSTAPSEKPAKQERAPKRQAASNTQKKNKRG